jgi:hypothetical protein
MPGTARRFIRPRKWVKARHEVVEMGLRALIQTCCIEERLPLLYSDRGFDSFVEHLGLQRVQR